MLFLIFLGRSTFGKPTFLVLSLRVSFYLLLVSKISPVPCNKKKKKAKIEVVNGKTGYFHSLSNFNFIMKSLLVVLKSGWEIFKFSYVDVYNSLGVSKRAVWFVFVVVGFFNNQKGYSMTFCFLSFQFGGSLHWVTMILLIKMGYSYCVITWSLSLCV